MEKLGDNSALVVLSGGQDSMTCLEIALNTFSRVRAVCFRYGQKHAIELEQAQRICAFYNVPLKEIDLSFFGALVTSALTSNGDTAQEHAYKAGLPASFVPNRNALFLTIAHALAQEYGTPNIFTGVCQTDYSGYPDCREKFIKALETALNIGYETDITIHTPLMHLTKAQTFAVAAKHNFLATVLEYSHTCYSGDRTQRHEWGYGCGECPACQLRAKGWEEYKASVGA